MLPGMHQQAYGILGGPVMELVTTKVYLASSSLAQGAFSGANYPALCRVSMPGEVSPGYLRQSPK